MAKAGWMGGFRLVSRSDGSKKRWEMPQIVFVVSDCVVFFFPPLPGVKNGSLGGLALLPLARVFEEVGVGLWGREGG